MRALIGRDEAVAAAECALAGALAGSGRLLFVAGEAGIGKTRLLSAVADRARAKNLPVVRAAAFPGDDQSYAGLLLDLAGDLARAREPALAALGRDLSARARASAPTGGDAHRRRRLLVQDLADLLVSAEPVLIILEDLHWADELSLDVLGHLAHRLAATPVLVAAAYRSDELPTRLPMRELRARLLSQRLADEVRLPRLGPAQTAALAAALLGRPAPERLVAALHERGDGIPLHIEELLAATDALTPQAVRTATVPDTLGDAVLSRVRSMSAATRAVASAAAVIGRSFDFDLLTAVTGAEPTAVADALRDLRDAQLVLPGADAVTFDFRHALIRDTLYADTDLPVRRRMHGRVARAALEQGGRDAFVSAHFELAQDDEAAHRHAKAASRAAAAVSAHGEALELYRRAVRTAPDDLAPADRARLYAALGDEAAATDDNPAAAAAYRTAHELFGRVGDRRAAAALAPAIAAVAHLLGDGVQPRVALLRAALDSLDGVDDADRERARLHSALANVYMLDRQLEEAIEYGERSHDVSRRIGDDGTALNAAATLGCALVFAGRSEGWRWIEGGIADAREAHREAETARGYRMLGCTTSVLVEYDRAERWLVEGMRYAEKVELQNHRHYAMSHLAHVQWATGAWDAAAATAQRALDDGRGGITTRITAQYVLGFLAIGRGGPFAPFLEDALALGDQLAELERWSPPLWGLAEAARIQGDHETALRHCERGYQASAAITDAVCLFPYLVTGVRAHLLLGDVDAAEAWSDRVAAVLSARGIPGTLPAIDHGRGLVLLARGDLPAAQRCLESASRAWQERRRFWEGTWALLDLAEVHMKARRRASAGRLVSAVREAASAVGAGTLLSAADGVSRPLSHPLSHPLSEREFQVSGLVAAGLTNRQIADRLTVAPKTVSAHVEHILTKLGAARRAEIAAWYATIHRAP